MSSSPRADRGRRAILVACAVVAVGAIVAAAVDFGVTSAKVDPIPADCAQGTDIACQNARNQRLSERHPVVVLFLAADMCAFY